MFLKATTPLIRDTVKVMDTAGAEITRFVAVWKRPDSKDRKALLKARMENLKSLQAAQGAFQDDTDDGMAAFDLAISAIEDDGKARIRGSLSHIEGLLDADDAPVDYTPAVLDEMFRWAEYTVPLAESLARLAEGRTVEEEQVKNSAPLDSSGQDLEPAAAA
jgi:hypothetical protein